LSEYNTDTDDFFNSISVNKNSLAAVLIVKGTQFDE
jgi:hypothetical protein